MSDAETDDRQEKFSGTKEVADRYRFDVKKLESYLAERIEGFQTPLEVRQFKGGQSNPTYQLVTPNRKYVLQAQAAGQASAVGPCGRSRIPRHLGAASDRLSRRQALSAVRGRKHHRHDVLCDGLRGGPHLLGAASARLRTQPNARPSTMR